MSQVTRGGLAPGKLINLSTNQEVRFMFNPFEYTLSKSNQWEHKPVIGQNLPAVVFQQGGAQQLSLTLYFDGVATGTDVRTYTAPLWKMMMLDSTQENSKTGKSAPPAVAFSWGRLYFKSIINSLSEHFTVFGADGTPLRCSVNITLEQFLDATEPAAQTTSSTGTSPAPSQTVVQGDRMDHVAANGTGDANNYRSVAEANNVDNPMKLTPGQQMKMP
ncbi:MAG: hypothetical protein U0670_10625 [Anaerolineae bacterium]